MNTSSDYISVEDAGKLLSVSSRTVRNWIVAGKLPAISGKRGRLVSRADVLRIGTLTGKVPKTVESVSLSDESSDRSSAELPEERSVMSAATARDQLEAIRDEWLAPLIDRIGELEREAGRLTAEREHAQRQAEIATLEREAVKAERDALLAAQDALRSRLSALEEERAESPDEPMSTSEIQPQRPWWRFWERET